MRVLLPIVAALLVFVGILFYIAHQPPDEHPTSSQRTPTDLIQVATALELYREERGRYPSAEEGLEVLVDRYLPGGELSDGWGKPIRYEPLSAQGELSYRICSAGPGGEYADSKARDDRCFSPE